MNRRELFSAMVALIPASCLFGCARPSGQLFELDIADGTQATITLPRSTRKGDFVVIKAAGEPLTVTRQEGEQFELAPGQRGVFSFTAE